MFTGIIEGVGRIVVIQRKGNSVTLKIHGGVLLEDVRLGDSIAVNGVCLTVTACLGDVFTADIMHETLSKTSLSTLRSGGRVNLERAMRINGRFGGHIVSGHIDGTGVITKIQKDGIAVWYTIKTVQQILNYTVEKGSIAIDGISLTVAKVTNQDFSISVIPHTLGNTTLSEKRVQDVVNLENDCVGKYVEKLLCNELSETNRRKYR